jgi:hypothetical protein
MSRLREMARAAAAEQRQAPPEPEPERCDLCSAPIPPEHRHLIDLESRELRCTCQPCRILFEGDAAGGGHYRLVPERRLRLDDFAMDEVRWAELRIPVDMAFFFRHSGEGRVVAFYPSPAGPTESLLELDAWEELERDNPVLRELEPDVEALLVNRARGAAQHLIVPIDDPYRLVALIRTRWRGFTGGSEVWEEIDAFFTDLAERAQTTTTTAREEAAWQTT